MITRRRLDLPIDSSVAQVTAALKMEKFLSEWDYPKDRDWEWHVLQSINTLEDAEQFCKRLDAENRLQRGCTKARVAREWLAKPFWQQSPDRLRTPFGDARRVCCCCHETGSFARKQH